MKNQIKTVLKLTCGALIIILTFFSFSHQAHAAPLVDIPISLTQPDGSALDCFASGDEFFNYLHDANGYLIIQHPQTGYYVYASIDGNAKLTVSNNVAVNYGYSYDQRLRISAASYFRDGITVGDIDFAVNSALIRSFDVPEFLEPPSAPSQAPSGGPDTVGITRANPVTGIHENVVIMICFAGENPTIYPEYANQVMSYFNNPNMSLKSYMRTVSRGVFEINSTLVGMDNATVLMYQDAHPRGYYQPYNAVTNPIGYVGDPTDSSAHEQREHTLLANAVRAVDGSSLLKGKNLDMDNNGWVDCVSFIISGSTTAWGTLLWPHSWVLYLEDATLNGKWVFDYTFYLQSMLGISVIVHETLHNYSYPDLYRYSGSGDPVGQWDVMATNTTPPQLPNTHTNLRYAGWGGPLVVISENGRYTLSPHGSKNGITAYAVPTAEANQFILLEYRSNRNGTGLDDQFNATSYYREGLTITRVNTAFSGNENTSYSTVGHFEDEVYIYRPNETGVNNAAGNTEQASLSASAARTSFGYDGGTGHNGYIYLFDGSNTDYVISNVSAADDTISFDIRIKPQSPGNTVSFVSGNNGSLSATCSGAAFSSGQTAPDGTSVIFTAEPDFNYIVDKWIVDGVAQPAGGNTLTLDNITASQTVIVTFKPDPDKTTAAPVITTYPSNLSSLNNETVVTVTLTTSTSGAKIFYTLDNTTPTTASIEYNGPFTVEAGSIYSISKRVTAYAVRGTDTPSGMVYIDLNFPDKKEYTILQISVGNPRNINVTSSDSLILEIKEEVSATPGKTIDIWAMPKGYMYIGTTAIPISAGGSGYKFTYTLPPVGLDLVQGIDMCTVTIPFGLFLNDAGHTLADWIASDDIARDDFRSYNVVVEAGAFANTLGVNNTFSANDVFFSASQVRPAIISITPKNGAQGVLTIGTIVIEFSKQMNKTGGSIDLSYTTPSGGSGSIGFSYGSWSADGRTHTMTFNRLTLGTTYTINVSGFLDPDDNIMLLDRTNKFTVGDLAIRVGNPQYTPVIASDSLILIFNRPVTAVAGKIITITAFTKSFEYSGTIATPVSANSGTVNTFNYTIPSEGLISSQSGDEYMVSIPFNQLMSTPTFSLATMINSQDDYDARRAYRVVVPAGAFVDEQGMETNSINLLGAFFSRSIVKPTIASITPADGKTDCAISGEIVIEFSKQMDKATTGTVSLTTIGALEPGVWSADGRIYTVPYSGLAAGRAYSIGIYGFSDPDDNVMNEHTSSFSTQATQKVTGIIRSYNPQNETLVELYLTGTEHLVASKTIDALSSGSGQITQEFTLEGVPEGVYDLVVSKQTHLSYTIIGVTVGSEDLDLSMDPDEKINTISLPCGDINNDGMINDDDLTILWLLVNYNRHINNAENPLCDLNGDGVINDIDLTILWLRNHYNKGATSVKYRDVG